MEQKHLAIMAGVSVTAALAMVLTNHIVHGQSQPPASIYNPYPMGILPSNLDSEVARVLQEVDFIENEAIGQWKALPPPDFDGQPANTSGHRSCLNRNTRQVDELRQNHVALQ